MGWLPMIRRVSALTLVVTLTTIGVPVPVYASGEQEQPSAQTSVLTLNGQPLSQFSRATATPRALFPLAGFLRQGTGQILGVALDGDGQRVADGTVQLRQVPEQGALPDPVAVDTTTDANGRFSFAGLGQGQYVVDLLIDGQVVATGGPFSLAEGGMLFVEVGGAASQPATDKGRDAPRARARSMVRRCDTGCRRAFCRYHSRLGIGRGFLTSRIPTYELTHGTVPPPLSAAVPR